MIGQQRDPITIGGNGAERGAVHGSIGGPERGRAVGSCPHGGPAQRLDHHLGGLRRFRLG